MLSVRVGCPLWVSSLLFLLNCISHQVKISCELPLCCSQKLDGYLRMNNKSLIGGQVGVYCEEFSEGDGVSHVELPDLG